MYACCGGSGRSKGKNGTERSRGEPISGTAKKRKIEMRENVNSRLIRSAAKTVVGMCTSAVGKVPELVERWRGNQSGPRARPCVIVQKRERRAGGCGIKSMEMSCSSATTSRSDSGALYSYIYVYTI